MTDQPAPEAPLHIRQAEGLRQLADAIEQNPAVGARLTYALRSMTDFIVEDDLQAPSELRAFHAAMKAAGADVNIKNGEDACRVRATFPGAVVVTLQASAEMMAGAAAQPGLLRAAGRRGLTVSTASLPQTRVAAPASLGARPHGPTPDTRAARTPCKRPTPPTKRNASSARSPRTRIRRPGTHRRGSASPARLSLPTHQRRLETHVRRPRAAARNAANGSAQQVKPHRERILALEVSPELVADGTPIDATGAKRRVHALVARLVVQQKLAEPARHGWQQLPRVHQPERP
jgi:hypothetical protein